MLKIVLRRKDVFRCLSLEALIKGGLAVEELQAGGLKPKSGSVWGGGVSAAPMPGQWVCPGLFF